MPRQPTDRNGEVVAIGDLVRIINLSGDWFDNLPSDERERVESMIGEVLAVEGLTNMGSLGCVSGGETEKRIPLNHTVLPSSRLKWSL